MRFAFFFLLLSSLLFISCDDDSAEDGDSGSDSDQGSDDDNPGSSPGQAQNDDDNNDDNDDDDDNDDNDDDDNDDNDNNDDNNDDNDDLSPTEPSLFLIGKKSGDPISALRLDGVWHQQTIPDPASFGREYAEYRLSPGFALDGQTVYIVWNHYDYAWYLTRDYEVLKFDLAGGWQRLQWTQTGRNVDALHAADPDHLYTAEFYLDYGLENVGYRGRMENGAYTVSPPMPLVSVDGLFYYEAGKGYYSLAGGDDDADEGLYHEVDGVTTPVELPSPLTGATLRSSWFFDADNGWGTRYVSPGLSLLSLKDGAWSGQAAPSDHADTYLMRLEFYDKTFGVLLNYSYPDEYAVYENEAWSVKNLPLPEGDFHQFDVHIAEPGHFFILLILYDGPFEFPYLYEIQDDVASQVALPAGMDVVSAVFTLGPGSPHFASSPNEPL